MHDRSSRKRLGPGAAVNFPSDRLFDRIGRAVCRASCLARKELYESWEVARRARRRLRGSRIVDLASGHGLVAQMLLLLDPAYESAVAVDTRIPQSAQRLLAELSSDWPRLREQVRFQEQRLQEFELQPGDVVVSAHACGVLTDRVLDLAIGADVPVAVLPCCQAFGKSDLGNLEGWLDKSLAVDVVRAMRLREAGFKVWTQSIPDAITPKNRLLIGSPR